MRFFVSFRLPHLFFARSVSVRLDYGKLAAASLNSEILRNVYCCRHTIRKEIPIAKHTILSLPVYLLINYTLFKDE